VVTKRETGGTIARMLTVANMIWEAAREKGIELKRPEEYRQDGVLHHFWLDVPVGDQTCRVFITRPDYWEGTVNEK
jgi:hypothetical protein